MKRVLVLVFAAAFTLSIVLIGENVAAATGVAASSQLHYLKRKTRKVAHRTKYKAKYVGRKTEKGTRWTAHKTKRGTKKAYVKTKETVH